MPSCRGKGELLSAPMPCFRVLERIRRHEQQRLQDFVVGGMRVQQLLHQVEQEARIIELAGREGVRRHHVVGASKTPEQALRPSNA